MGYRIIHSDERGVRLRVTSFGNAISAFGVLFGMVFGLVGGGMAFYGTGQSVHIGYAFLCGALLFSVAPTLLIRQRSIMDPRELIFDNQSGLLAVLQRGPTDPLRGFLPYDEADCFDVRKDKVQSSSTSTTLTHYVYTVTLRLKGGGEWDLFSYGSEEKALATCAMLAAAVKLSNPSAALPDPVLPSNFRVESDSSVTALRWRNAFPFSMLLFFVLFFGTFFSLMYFFNRVSPDHGWHQKVMLGGGLFVFVGVMWNFLRSVLDSQRISITADEFKLQRLNASGEARSEKTLRTAEVLGVKFDFGEQAGAGGLQVYTAESQTVMGRVRKEGFSFGALLADLKTAARSTIRIDVGMVTMAERLNIESYLNRAINRARAGSSASPARSTPPGSYWWESALAPGTGIAGSTDGLFGRLLSNAFIGVLTIIMGPLPLIAFFFGAMNAKTPLGSLIFRSSIALEGLSCLLVFVVASRLFRARTALIRAGLAALCAVAVLLQHVHVTALMVWPMFLLVPLAIAAGLALLNLPVEDL